MSPYSLILMSTLNNPRKTPTTENNNFFTHFYIYVQLMHEYYNFLPELFLFTTLNLSLLSNTD